MVLLKYAVKMSSRGTLVAIRKAANFLKSILMK
jgi:hypothetical protein